MDYQFTKCVSRLLSAVPFNQHVKASLYVTSLFVIKLCFRIIALTLYVCKNTAKKPCGVIMMRLQN